MNLIEYTYIVCSEKSLSIFKTFNKLFHCKENLNVEMIIDVFICIILLIGHQMNKNETSWTDF